MTPDDGAEMLARLRAQLDKDERIARAARGAGEGRWRYDGTAASGPTVATGRDDDDRWTRNGNMSLWTCDDVEDGCHEIANQWEAEGEHIAHHDPALVLAEVAAKRLIIAECEYEIQDAQKRDTGDGLGLAETVLELLAQPHAGAPDGVRSGGRDR